MESRSNVDQYRTSSMSSHLLPMTTTLWHGKLHGLSVSKGQRQRREDVSSTALFKLEETTHLSWPQLQGRLEGC